MITIRNIFALCMLSWFLAACASTAPSKRALPDVKAPPSMAVVYGSGGGVGGFFKGLLMPLGTKKELRLNIVDDEPAEEVPDVRAYLVQPGERTLGVYCKVQVDSQLYHGSAKIVVTLEAGRKYALDARLAEGRCVFDQPCTVCEPTIAEVPKQ